MEKVKEAIDLLSSALTDEIEIDKEKDEGNDVNISTRSNSSSTSSSARSAEQISASSSSSSEATYSKRSNSSRAVSACGQALDALTHLRQMRLGERRANFQPYQPSTSNPGKRRASICETSVGAPSKTVKVSKPSPWSHKFVCLSSTTASKVPTSAEKCLLSSVGLGEKVIKFHSMEVMLDEFQDIIKFNYPKLEESGGFDLLKCRANSRELEEFSYMVTYPLPRIQHNAPNGRIYIRPLQKDLKLGDDDDEVDWVIYK